MPSVEQNKEIVRRWYELYSQGDIDRLSELHSDNLVSHAINSPVPEQHGMRGRQAGRELFAAHRASFPDWREDIDFMIGEGDLVAVFHTGRGTHRGDFAGRRATNRPTAVTALDVIRIDDDGKVVEHWGVNPWQEAQGQ